MTQKKASKKRPQWFTKVISQLHLSMRVVFDWAKKRPATDYVWLFLVSVVVCMPLFSMQTIYGHDGEFHLYRFKGFWDAFVERQIIPQVDPHAVDGYGHGVGIFYGPVVPFFVSLLHLIFPSWSAAANMFCFVAVIFSGMAIYWFVRDTSAKRSVALVAGLLYLTMPYRLEGIYVRQAYGEIAVYALAPLVFWGIHRILYQKKYGTLLLALSAAAVFLSHNISVVIIGLFSVLYIAGQYRLVNWRAIRGFLWSTLIALGLSAFFWLPLMKSLSSGIYNVSSLDFIMHRSTAALQGSALDLQYLFFDIGYKAGLNFFIGIVPITGLALLFFLLIRGDLKNQRTTRQSFFLALIALLIVTPLVQWQFMPSFMHAIQFPWRFLSMFDLFLSIAIAYASFYFYDRYARGKGAQRMTVIATVLLSCLVVMSATSAMLRVRYEAPITFDYSMKPRQIHGVAMGEYLPREALKSGYIYARSPIEVLSGDAHVSAVTYDGLTVKFRVKATTASRVELPRIYYDGYTSLNTHVTASPHGLVEVTIEPTESKEVVVQFELSSATKIGLGITVVTIMCVVGSYRRFAQKK